MKLNKTPSTLPNCIIQELGSANKTWILDPNAVRIHRGLEKRSTTQAINRGNNGSIRASLMLSMTRYMSFYLKHLILTLQTAYKSHIYSGFTKLTS